MRKHYSGSVAVAADPKQATTLEKAGLVSVLLHIPPESKVSGSVQVLAGSDGSDGPWLDCGTLEAAPGTAVELPARCDAAKHVRLVCAACTKPVAIAYDAIG